MTRRRGEIRDSTFSKSCAPRIGSSRVRNDPQLAAIVEPLTDRNDGPSELATMWHFNKPAIIGLVAFVLVFVYLMLNS